MIGHYPLVSGSIAKAAYLLGFGGSANPIGLAQNQVRRTLEFRPVSRCSQRRFFFDVWRDRSDRVNRMSISPAMRRFTLAHPNIVVIPAEALDEHGLEPEFAELLITDGRLSADQVDCLERGTALYWQRCRDLFARAPGSWFPPRQTNLLIISEQRGVFPYMEPFIGTSSLLYASDLDTHPEYVAYMLVHVDRLALLPSVRAALVCNLSYWFDRDDASRSAFASAAARAKRPDAQCFTALSKAFDWIDQLLHIPLREPQAGPHRALSGRGRSRSVRAEALAAAGHRALRRRR